MQALLSRSCVFLRDKQGERDREVECHVPLTYTSCTRLSRHVDKLSNESLDETGGSGGLGGV